MDAVFLVTGVLMVASGCIFGILNKPMKITVPLILIGVVFIAIAMGIVATEEAEPIKVESVTNGKLVAIRFTRGGMLVSPNDAVALALLADELRKLDVQAVVEVGGVILVIEK